VLIEHVDKVLAKFGSQQIEEFESSLVRLGAAFYSTVYFGFLTPLSFKFLVKRLQYFGLKVLLIIRIVVSALVITGSGTWLTCSR
jgi:hypothetical protein